MTKPDLNLLYTLDVILAEGNVARAARKLHLSPSAMSRALARLRHAAGDPLLVRAGRGLVPTPRALELRDRVGPIMQAAQSLFHAEQQLNLKKLVRTFTLRTSDGFVENFGPPLLARINTEAPGVRLSFVAKSDREDTGLRDGRVDLETGVIGVTSNPELRVQKLFPDRFIGVVRKGHPLTKGRMTPARYVAGEHVLFSRRGGDSGPIDEVLSKAGLARKISVIVGGFATALALARSSDLIASVPDQHTANLRSGMYSFALPISPIEINVSMFWHPRMDADPAHKWLRTCVKEICSK